MYFGLCDNGLSLYDIARYTCGTLVPENAGVKVSYGISIDSRSVKSGDVFFAVKGESFDGYDFISEAVAAGAYCVVTDRVPADCSIPYILVKNTVKALGETAHAYKRLFSPITVAVTGSVGKTTTKELIYTVLDTKYQTHRTEGNHNNEIGLPFTLLSLNVSHQALVAEMGMSARGEISYLSKLTEPDISVITNIGTAHIEKLGTRENIRDAKLEIINGMKPGGVLILNGDEPLLESFQCDWLFKVCIGIENKNCDYYAENITYDSDYITFDVYSHGEPVLCVARINTVGKHNIYNALAAIIVGMLVGVKDEEILRGLLDFEPAVMRQTIYSKGDITVIEDCYNANPESMAAAFGVLSHVAKENNSRMVAVLGEMRELGVASPSLHRRVGEIAAEVKTDKLIIFGKSAENIAVGALSKNMKSEDIVIIPDTDDIENATRILRQNLGKGDTVLFKASRAVALERLVKSI